ncbi:hypothetical protein GC173_18740 [bacterium]|nr:hypothetical protein [bacterium]
MSGRRQVLVLLLVPVALCLIGFFGLSILRADRFAGYSVHPLEFRAQMDVLRPGMTAAEIHRAVSRWDEVSTTATHMVFTIRPRERRGMVLPRIDEHIRIELDENGRLKSSRLTDG